MAVTYRCSGRIELAQGCAQASTSSTAPVVDSELHADGWRGVQYTIVVRTHDVKWSVFGANDPAWSDEICVQAATKVVIGATGTYTDLYAAYKWYRVKIIDDVAETHGNVTVTGILTG